MLKSRQPIRTTGNNLVGLWRPSFVKVNHQLFVYGGGGNNVTNDLHVLNLCDMQWKTIQTMTGIAPCKRYGHTATLWKHYIIVFGGCNEYQAYCNDIHLFDLEKLAWYHPEIKGSVSARYLHSAVVHDDKLFVYGGFSKNTDCTYVLDEISVLDLNTFTWSIFQRIPPRYNHSATLIGHKMYIYGGKDEQGNTVSDLFMVNLNHPPYTPHLILSGNVTSSHSSMVLLKSQHFCEAVCGKLLVFGRYINNTASRHSYSTTVNSNSNSNSLQGNGNGCDGTRRRIMAATTTTTTTTTATPDNNTPESTYGLWMLDLDTLEWERQNCDASFGVGGWNYFTVITENIQPMNDDGQPQVTHNSLLFLGNTQHYRPQGYDHFRDALVIDGESLGLYDIPSTPPCANAFGQLLNNPELSDFVITSVDGQELFVHQVILMTRWPHFRNMYKSGMAEARQGRMQIDEPYSVLLAFLQYLYMDHLAMDVPWDVVADLLVLANMYLLVRLKKICCQRLWEQHLAIDTCTTVFTKAIMTDEAGLKLLALDFMFQHYGALLKAGLIDEMAPLARSEFLECIPDDTMLQIGRLQPPPRTAITTITTDNNNNSMLPSSSLADHHQQQTPPPPLYHYAMVPLNNHPSQQSALSSQQIASAPHSTNHPSTTTNHIPTPPSSSSSATTTTNIPNNIMPTDARFTSAVTRHERLSSSSNEMVMGV